MHCVHCTLYSNDITLCVYCTVYTLYVLDNVIVYKNKSINLGLEKLYKKMCVCCNAGTFPSDIVWPLLFLRIKIIHVLYKDYPEVSRNEIKVFFLSLIKLLKIHNILC